MTFIPSINSKLLTNNSTTTPLGISGTFTGTSDDIKSYASVTVVVSADESSAENGFQCQFSMDNTTWATSSRLTYNKNANFELNIPKEARYFRVVFTNGTTAQTTFEIQTFADVTFNGQMTEPVKCAQPYIENISFGRQQVSNPDVLLQLTHIYDNNSLLESTATTGSGTVTYVSNQAANVLEVTGAGTAAVQSRVLGLYQPGNLLTVLLTGVLDNNNNQANTVGEIGYFNSGNGLFFRLTGPSTYAVVIRSDVSGSPVDTVIPQSNWNVDPLDGTGPSGVTIDFSKTQIFKIDFEWLGVGTVRFGLSINGKYIYCHIKDNANVMGTVYMRTPYLPIRYALTSTGGNAQLQQCCSTIITDGLQVIVGRPFSVVRSATIGIGATRAPILSFQFKTGSKNRSINAKIKSISVVSTSGANFVVEVWLFQDIATASTILTGASFTSANAISAMNYDESATAVTVTNGFLVSSKLSSNNNDLLNIDTGFLKMTSNISDVSDIVVVAVFTLGGKETFSASVDWEEFGQ